MPYSTAVKNARMTVVRDAIDAGAGAGVCKIFTAGYATLLVTCTFDTVCGTVAAGVLTMTGFPKNDVTPAANGTAAIARFEDSTGVIVRDDVTVGVGGGFNVQLGSTAINTGTNVDFVSASIAHG